MTKSSTDIDLFLDSLNDKERERLARAVKEFTEWLITRQQAKTGNPSPNNGSISIARKLLETPKVNISKEG